MNKAEECLHQLILDEFVKYKDETAFNIYKKHSRHDIIITHLALYVPDYIEEELKAQGNILYYGLASGMFMVQIKYSQEILKYIGYEYYINQTHLVTRDIPDEPKYQVNFKLFKP